MMSARLRVWFLRNLLEAAERELGAQTVASLPARVPQRLRDHLSLDRLRNTAALDSIPLDEGEDAVFAIEQALGDGSGRTLERIACEMLARQLVQAAAAVRVGDLYGTLARLRGPIEHPFIDAGVSFELQKTPLGLTLSVGVPGRPRATRMLGHVAAAAVDAAERFARESHAEPLRVELQVFADRARIDARFRRASTAPPPDAPPMSARRSSFGARIVPSLSDEVARILNPSLAERSRSSIPAEPPPSRPPGEPVSVRRSDLPPRPNSVPPPRRSEAPPAPSSEPRGTRDEAPDSRDRRD